MVAQPLHWLLSKLHALTGNWGVAIILLVLDLKAALWKLTAAQFRSGAKMRKLQPRMNALKERYGDDKMKMQQAMMELYKKEKVNPMCGLPAGACHHAGVLRSVPRTDGERGAASLRRSWLDP